MVQWYAAAAAVTCVARHLRPLAVAVLQTPLALALALPLAPQLVAIRDVAAVGAVVVVGAAGRLGAAVRRGRRDSCAAALARDRRRRRAALLARALRERAQLVSLLSFSRAAIFFWICARFSTSSRADLRGGGGGVSERRTQNRAQELRAELRRIAPHCAAAAAHRSAM